MNAPLKKCSAYGADLFTPHLPQAVFQRRVSTDTDTVFASARPGAADETTANGTDKSVPYKFVLQNAAAHLRYAKRYGFLRNREPGHQR